MRERLHSIPNCFWMSVLLLTAMSLTFLMMPIADHVEGNAQRFVLVMVGILFWGSSLGGYFFWVMTYRNYKELLRKDPSKANQSGHVIGAFELFSNTQAAVADAMLIADVAVMAIMTIWGRMDGMIPYIVLAVLIFSIHMHCIFNGNIYREVIYKKEKEK